MEGGGWCFSGLDSGRVGDGWVQGIRRHHLAKLCRMESGSGAAWGAREMLKEAKVPFWGGGVVSRAGSRGVGACRVSFLGGWADSGLQHRGTDDELPHPEATGEFLWACAGLGFGWCTSLRIEAVGGGCSPKGCRVGGREMKGGTGGWLCRWVRPGEACHRQHSLCFFLWPLAYLVVQGGLGGGVGVATVLCQLWRC